MLQAIIFLAISLLLFTNIDASSKPNPQPKQSDPIRTKDVGSLWPFGENIVSRCGRLVNPVDKEQCENLMEYMKRMTMAE